MYLFCGKINVFNYKKIGSGGSVHLGFISARKLIGSIPEIFSYFEKITEGDFLKT